MLFLTMEEILAIHIDQIERYGGDPAIRDMALLESACAMPQSMFGGQFLHKDIFEMAAAYLFHIVQNHPFVDGNKRTGATSAIVFLALNDVELKANESGLVIIVLKTAQGKMDKAGIAEFLRTNKEA